MLCACPSRPRFPCEQGNYQGMAEQAKPFRPARQLFHPHFQCLGGNSRAVGTGNPFRNIRDLLKRNRESQDRRCLHALGPFRERSHHVRSRHQDDDENGEHHGSNRLFRAWCLVPSIPPSGLVGRFANEGSRRCGHERSQMREMVFSYYRPIPTIESSKTCWMPGFTRSSAPIRASGNRCPHWHRRASYGPIATVGGVPKD